MKEFINKLIAKLEEIPTKNKCSECPHKQKCDEIEAMDKDEQIDLCGATIKSLAIDAVKEIAEEYKNENIITDFLQYARDNADNYDTNEGWSLADLIDLSIKFTEKYSANTPQNSADDWIPCSERLPQENEPVGTLCQIVNVMLKNGTVTSGWCNRYLEKWYVLDHHHDYPLPYEYKDVMAWQPLPQSYKEGVTENE